MSSTLPRLGAWVFALLHLLVVGVTLLSSGGQGEGQAFTVMLFDLPLVLLLELLPGGGKVLYGGGPLYVGVFLVAGTAMYAAIGYGFGFLTQAFAGSARNLLAGRKASDVKSGRRLALKLALVFVVLDMLAFGAIVGLGAATSLPMQGPQNAWLALHLPALWAAGALLSDLAPVQGPMPLAITVGFAIMCLLQPAIVGAFVGWLASILQARAKQVNADR